MAVKSLDFNPIENLQSELKGAVHKRKPKNIKDLEMCSAPLSDRHYRKRLSGVIPFRGGFTKY